MTEIDTASNEQQTASRQLNAGAIFAERFEIIGKLGEGGMSTVYKARNVAINRLVALKVLHNWMIPDTRAQQRFRREAQVVSTLSHPNIVGVQSVGMTDGEMFLVMDYIEGKSLAEHIQARRLTAEEVVAIALPAAKALAHAHAHGIVHRDIKPSNIMLSSDGAVKLVDFGVAKDFQHVQQNLTQTNAVVGTPFYMSPEQCERHDIDLRADIYSFGCVLYEMLNGSAAFQGDSAFEVMLKHVHEEPAVLPKSVPAWLAGAVMKMLEKKPADRFQSMDEIVSVLENASAPSVVPNRPANGNTRRRVSLSFICAVAVVIGGFSVFGYFAFNYFQTSARESHEAQRAAEALRVRTQLQRMLNVINRDWSTPKLPTMLKEANMTLDTFKAFNPPAKQWVPLAESILRVERHLADVQHRREDARRAANEVLRITQIYPGEDGLLLARSCCALVETHVGFWSTEATAKAVQMADDAVRRAQPKSLPAKHEVLSLGEELCSFWDMLGMEQKALDMARFNMQFAAKHLAEERDWVASAEFYVGANHRHHGRLKEAEEILTRILPDLESSQEQPFVRMSVHGYEELREVAYARRDQQAALKWLRRVLKVDEKLRTQFPSVEDYSLWTATHYIQMANTLLALGQLHEAGICVDRAYEFVNKCNKREVWLWVDLSHAAGVYQLRKGNFAKADSTFEVGMEWMRKHRFDSVAGAAMCHHRSLVQQLHLNNLPAAIQSEETAVAVAKRLWDSTHDPSDRRAYENYCARLTELKKALKQHGA